MSAQAPSARRVPHLNWANAFTFLRVLLVPVFAWLLLVREPSEPFWAAVVFAFAAATDGFDGWVARRWDLVSGFGQFLDPLADKLLVGTALVALALDGRIPWWVVGVILFREFAVGVGMRLWLARRALAMPASHLAKLKTASQILAVLLLTTLDPGSVWALGVLYFAVALTALSALFYVSAAVGGRGSIEWR